MNPNELPGVKIAEAAKHRMLDRPHLTRQRLWCEFDGGRLFLRGQVPSFYLKQLAQEAVVGLEGVHQVINEIEVVW
jgi:osmotically-inducible protein OsmY